MKEQDQRAVEGMANCGIDLEGLIKAFPNFPPVEVEEVYNMVNTVKPADDESIYVSRNCS